VNNLTILLYGDSKQGKSWTADSAPGPRLLIETEGRHRLTPSNKVVWDPRTPLPGITTDDTVVVIVRSFEDFKLIHPVLASGQHYFRSVIIDGLTELQQRLIDNNVAGTAALDLQDYGGILRELSKEIRKYRDLRQNPHKELEVFVCTAGERERGKAGKIKPLVDGQIADRLSYHFDVVGYMQHKPNSAGTYDRVISIDGQNPLYVSGSNWHAITEWYGKDIIVPDISTGRRIVEEMFNVINQPGVAPLTEGEA